MLVKLMILAAAAATMTTTAAAVSKNKAKTKTAAATAVPTQVAEAQMPNRADRLFEPTAESYGMDYMYV